jgi:hypothetical protein
VIVRSTAIPNTILTTAMNDTDGFEELPLVFKSEDEDDGV